MFKRMGRTHSLATRFTCLALALTVLGAVPERAEAKSAKDVLLGGLGSGLSKGASWGAGFLLNAIAGGLYAGFCGKDQVNDAAGELLCMTAGKVTGEDEKEWRDGVGAKLDTLREQLDAVQAGQTELNDAIGRQSDVLREALKNLPAEVQIESHLSNIQNAWAAFNDHFRYAEPKSPEATRESLQKLARNLVGSSYDIGKSAIALRVAIVEGSGREGVPLPLMLAKQIDSWPRAGRNPEEWDGKDPEEFDVRPLYLELELAMRQWILRQQQAQVLYLWSARALEGTPDAPRQTASEYGKSYAANIEAQLESFQRAVEWLVLANSFPRSPFANFLPSHAEEVFARADAFQALALSTSDDVALRSAGQAIWGRVIALGPGPGSTLTLKSPGNSPLPLKASITARVPIKGWPELDGWSASNLARPLVFDRIDFGSEWTVYRFKQPLANDARLGDYRFAAGDAGNALPYLPSVVSVDDSLGEITGRASERFGSFVGIARAGGAYALFSGEFDQRSSESWGEPSKPNVNSTLARVPSASDLDTTIDQRKRIQRVDTTRGTMPRPIVGETIATRWVTTRGVNPITGSNRVEFSVDRKRSLMLRSRKTIRSRSGQPLELKLHVIWNQDSLGSPFGRPSEQVLVVAHDREGISSREVSFRSGLKITLGAPGGSPFNGVGVWINGTSRQREDRHEDRMDGQRSEGRAYLPAAGHQLEIAADFSLNLPRLPNVRTWTWLARASWQTAYLSR
ncbi:MAG TPA: hypothetical protein VLB76_25920 [Thermoanaerobaculia bacterium]|nr:hypothetical protein [Thermoanaerobaculia bacterium]